MNLFYHNPRCSKSRACLKIIKDNKINFQEILYLKVGLSISSLSEIINKLKGPINQIIRTNEKEFKKAPFDINKKKLIISFLHKFPRCLQRPIFFDGTNYVICRPPEIVLDYIKK